MSRERSGNDLEWDEAEEKEKAKQRRSDRQARLEEDVKKIAQDDEAMAREIVLLKKELSRLHYKVKHYHNQSRVVNAIVNSVVVLLLIAILYKLYS
jgi:hypothetical protein